MASKAYTVLGMMSGSSLDGLDLAICRFRVNTEVEWTLEDWEILASSTDPYPPQWRARLRTAPVLPGRELWRLHADLGTWIGRRAAAFLADHPQYPVDLVGSHGHTVFHDPDLKFTTQIGDGAAIAAEMGLPVVTELRGADVAEGGQGAPLAPLADKYLFSAYGAFLNLGGIVNLSVRQSDGTYLAGDVSACCQVMDRLAQKLGHDYDAGGHLAAGGKLAPAVTPPLDALDYHALPYPKSLDNGWVTETVWPLLKNADAEPRDVLHTFVRWLAGKIHDDLLGAGAGAGHSRDAVQTEVLCTGGGAHNDFLISCLREAATKAESGLRFVVPESTAVEFKEAALIALAALLRSAGRPNALASATGAPFDTVNGALFLPTKPVVAG
ncbi:anhydro-N-acetylmuramic acid kinase [Lewinella sp. W8]|uniref:anhydro-N-acetylmuramic acid kinase n=1 Tax=Lewinella sp. W8 TaxID=2528208 RepID=UPI001068368A|nr:anhydro-N-acetylmuramic acid kinase [Lewinella sp. W8]MTB53225.1 anhydro-N-acetylmuramic acid kinase [Lewinella sp. W8]